MNYRQHVLLGTGFCITVQLTGYLGEIPLLSIPTYYAGGALGSVLPDIDHPKSFIGSKIPIIPRLIYTTLGHRSITHSILALTTLGIATALKLHAGPYFLLGNFIGYLSHLVGDMLTPSGIPLFWPASKKRYCIYPLFKSHK